MNPSADFRVSTQLDVNVGLGYIRNSDDNQWYGNFTDSVNATHYSFAHLHQRTALATVQASYAATPTLTVELYAEPFVSVGQYDNLRQESSTPGAVAYDARYAPYAPPAGSSTGFDNRQLIWNTVMRWEYRPGSTLFVVWTQGRDEAAGMFPNESLSTEYHNLFAVHPANTFLVKVAYWLNK
jgi:hypothetical protein